MAKEKTKKAKSSKTKKIEVSYDIEEVYGMLDNGNKIYARISWNGNKAKDEIRNVWHDKDGKMRLGKGIDMDDAVIKELSVLAEKKPKPVDFRSVFEESRGIAERRNMDLPTEDGYIVLKPTTEGKRRMGR